MRQRTKDTIEVLFYMAFLLGCVGIVGLGVAQAIAKGTATPRCLRAGYPEAKVTWNFERFCVRRLDQTDEVVPLADVPR